MKQFRDTIYLVSENGEVFNSKTGRQLKPWKSTGYYMVGLGAKFRESIHRLVAEIYCEGYDPKLDVNHKDGNKLNNHYTNLEWCTRSKNIKHSYDMGMSKKRLGHKTSIGSKNAMSELTEDQVLEIRRMYKETKITLAKLGLMFNVHQATVGYIIQRKTWKHI